MSFHTITEKKFHLKSHGPLVKCWKCNLCNKQLTLRTYLQRHVRTVHHSTIRVSCVFCEGDFCGRQSLDKHIRRHIFERLLECELCFKQFYDGSDKSAHMRTHTLEKPHCCKICGRRFLKKTHMHRHERTHLSCKLYSCIFCGKNFRDNCQYWEHILKEIQEKSYFCKICGKGFNTKAALRGHTEVHQLGKYKCDKCKGVYKRSSTLRKHIQNKHSMINCLL